MMHMEHRLVQTQSQRLMLTQKMQQALKVLQFSGLELQDHIQQEIETNPLLELGPAKGADPASNGAAATDVNDAKGHDTANYDDNAFDLDTYRQRWEQRQKEGRDFSVNRDLAERREYYQNSITKEESLAHHLLQQLEFAVDDPTRYKIGERIIGDIDDRGYFTGSLEAIADELGVPERDVERMLYRIQRFEPTGVGARDIVECLLLQINVEYPHDAQLMYLVEHHLDDLKRRQIPKIAKAMNTTPERIEQLKARLSTLDPWPGREFSDEPTQYVAPDLVVEKIDDEWVVRLAEDRTPELRINKKYQKLAKNGGIDKEEKNYLRQKIESARWLIRNIEQRQDTILRIGKAIMEVQYDFLDHGVEKIKPLTLQEIADKVGVHEATVSRTTRGKYIQTPQGLFELKYFFSPGLKSASGEDQSSKSVQLRIKNIIDQEDKRKPLSDQKIADKLKEAGIKIARRTVTKYREAMNIPATTMRKEYQV